MELSFCLARPEDAPAVVDLVNRAYRPGAGARGWTHESDLVAGGRTEVESVRASMSEDGTALLLGWQGDSLVSCVQVQCKGGDAHLGMLAVRPDLQDAAIGKRTLAHAEAFAVSRLGARRLVVAVVSLRTELMAFYRRRGYSSTERILEYPSHANVGVPKRDDLKVLLMEKDGSGRL